MSQLTRNILWNLGGQAVLLLLGLIAVRFVFKQLGADAFGLILFAQTAAVVLVAVFDLGISATITREVAGKLTAQRGYVTELLRTATFIYWFGYLVLAATVIAAAPAVMLHWVNLKTIEPATAARVTQILACGALLALPRSLYGSLFRGLQRMGFNNAIEAGALAIQQLGIIIILAFISPHAGSSAQAGRDMATGTPLLAVALWFGASYAISVVAYIVSARRYVPGPALLPGWNAAVLRRNAGYAGHMMSNSVLAMVHSQSDRLLLSKLMPIGALGTYGFAATLVAGVARVTASIMQAAFPAFSHLYAQLDHAGLMRQYRKVQALAVAMTPPMFAALVFAGMPVLTYVFDTAVARSLMTPLVLLSIGSYMNATLSTPYTLSVAVGRPQIAVRQNLLALFVVLPLAAFLVYRFGLVGAASSWVVYHLFAYVYGLPRICRECLREPVLSWYAPVARAFALIAGTYGVAFAIAARANTAILLSAYVLATLAYAAASYALAPRDLRESIRRAPADWRRRAEAA
jgi:O-antigen/teichoic acid export membrane protein